VLGGTVPLAPGDVLLKPLGRTLRIGHTRPIVQ
jgi:hypothetical protein